MITVDQSPDLLVALGAGDYHIDPDPHHLGAGRYQVDTVTSCTVSFDAEREVRGGAADRTQMIQEDVDYVAERDGVQMSGRRAATDRGGMDGRVMATVVPGQSPVSPVKHEPPPVPRV